nr:response regulator [Nitrospirota bacterium]
MHVFVVDNDPRITRQIEQALQKHGHEVTVFQDAESAWGVCRNRLAPLIVLDRDLPGMGADGLDLCRRIRQLPQGDQSVIVVMTARNQPQELAMILDAGANDYLAKPIDPAVLALRLAVVERVAAGHQARQQAEAQLAERREAFDLAVQGSRDGLWDAKVIPGERWYDPQTPVWYSPRFKELLGFEEQEFAGVLRSLTLCLLPEERDRVMDGLRRHIEREMPFDEECRMRTKLGPVRWFNLRGQAVWNAKGEAVRIAGSLRDITERKAMEAQALQTQKMEAVGRLAGTLAADFNNLLTVIAGHSAMLMEDLDQADPRWASLNEIKEAGERAVALTKRLLAFGSNQVSQPHALDLNTLLTRLTPKLKGLLGEQVQLVMTLADDLGLVKADPAQMEQVILSLVANARDAMPQGGKLSLQTARVRVEETGQAVPPGSYAVLSVFDTGFGMDAETQARCFEPFFTTKPFGEGQGLGLTTVYGVLTQHQGAITMSSEPGQGTVFTVYLPSLLTPVALPKRRRPAAAPSVSPTILLVEDEEAIRGVARRILEQQGYSVLVASNGAEALRVLEQSKEPVDLLLTDLVMPGMSGRELAQRLAAANSSIKVLYISGYPADGITHHGVVESGMAFLAKPFTPVLLIEKVRAVLGMPAPA